MFKYKTKGNNKRGFTLVELVIVIAVIAVLAAVLIPTFTNIINSANESADTQLVANMNTALSTEVYADQTATAENLRKLLKDFGINDLTTRNKDNIIAYNQAKNRFEKINLKQVTIKQDSGSSVNNHRLMEDDETNTLTIDPNPFSFAEIFEGYTIVSTGGNEFAEAVYGLYTARYDVGEVNDVIQTFKTLWNNICNIDIGNETANVIAGFKNLLNKSVFLDRVVNHMSDEYGDYEITSSGIAFISSGIAFIQINDENEIHVVSVNSNYAMLDTNMNANAKDWAAISNPDRTIIFEKTNAIKVTPARVFVPETTTDLALYPLSNFGGAVVVIPNTLETVIIPGAMSTLDLSNIMFLGNTDVLYKAVGVDTAQLRGAQISSQHIQEIKESVKKYGAAVAQTEYYVVNSGHANEDKPHYYTELDKALQAAGDSADATGLPRQVIIASDYTIDSGNIAIPQNVTLHVPYSLDGNVKDNLGSGTDGAQKTLVDDELKTESNTDYKYDSGYKKCTLTISSGASLTVNGTLEVGAIGSAGEDNCYVGCVAGNYGQITNKGTITVAEGGRLNAYGYIKCVADGKVVVKEGATAYEPIVITDSVGFGALVSLIFTNNKFPYMRYALPNITKLEIECGGLLSVMKNTIESDSHQMSAGEGYFVGSGESDEKGGLLTLCAAENGVADGSVTIEYKFEHAVKDTNTNNNLAGDIGINTVTLNGNVKTGIVMSLGAEVQKKILSYIPYNFNYIISNNCTFTVTNKYAALPGAKITVAEGGTLCVASGGEFYVVDDYNSEGGLAIDGKSYPTAQQLKDAGLDTERGVIIQGTFKVESGAKVGGTVQVENGATITIVEGANLEGNFTIGAEIAAENSNKKAYNLPFQYSKGGTATKVENAGTITIS